MGRIRPTLAIAGCALGLLTGVAAQVRDQPREAAGGTGTITGRVDVVALEQRAPLRHATVLLARVGEKSTRTTTTDADGRFTFDRLPSGAYRADVRKAGFVSTSPAADLTVGGESQVTALIEMQRAGALEGRFLDDRGVPIERLRVTADLVEEPPTTRAVASYSATTDDLGRFRIHTLPPGRYQLHAAPPFPSSGEALFYPGTADRAEAGILTVASGQTVDQLDVTVPAAHQSPMAAEAAAVIEQEIASLPDTPEFSGRIEGRVTRSDLGVPIPNATVDLTTSTGLTLRTVTSDGNGAFSFNRLPEGRFVVSVRAPGFIDPAETAVGSGARGLLAAIAPGSRNAQTDVALAPGCAIEVRVADEFGEPAPGVRLRVFRKGSGIVEPTPVSADPTRTTTGLTDDRGWFRAYRLPAGDYYVMSMPEPLVRSGPSTFASTYFPGTTSADLASTVRVEAGFDAFNVSFGLIVARTATVSGVAVNSDGRRMPALAATLMPQGGRILTAAVLRTTTAADGSFAFDNVPEGAYTLSAFVSGWFGTMPVTVSPAADTEPAPVVLTMRRPSTARGRIVFDGAHAPPGPRPIVLHLTPTDLTPGLAFPEAVGMPAAAATEIGGESAFTLRNITAPGILRVFHPSGSPWILARVLLHGRDITDVPYDFHTEDVDGLEVVLTSRVGVVSGMVKDGDSAASVATVQIFGADNRSPHYVSRTTHSARTDEQGAFQITNVLPGRYFAIARRSSAGLAVSQLIDLRARATLVTVSEGGNASVTLAVWK